MSTLDLGGTAQAIVADGKGILAADETPGTLTKRFDAHRIESTPDIRRAYRELFFTTRGIAEYIGGVILQDETIRQRSRTPGERPGCATSLPQPRAVRCVRRARTVFARYGERVGSSLRAR